MVPVLVALILLVVLAAGAIYIASQLLRDPYVPDSELVTVAVPGNPIAIGAAFGSVWVAPFDSAESVLVELDPATGLERRRIPIAGHVCGYVVEGFGRLWFGQCPDLQLVSILDPATGDLQRLSGFVAAQIAFGDGSAWLTDGAGRLERVDPSSLATQAIIDVPLGTVNVAFGFGSAWAASPAGTLTRIDPETNQVTATIPVGEPGGDVRPLVAGQDAIWVVDEVGLGVFRVDQTTNVATRLDIELAPIRNDLYLTEHPIAAGVGSIWVRVDDVTIARIDPETLSVVERLQAPAGGGGFVVTDASLWATGPADGTVSGRRLP
jgi:YVTN family beta-propeller protein